MRFVSEKEFAELFQVSRRTVQLWVSNGLLREPLTEGQAEDVKENEHYVVCQVCGVKALAIHTPHLAKCCMKDLSWYTKTYPGAQTLSDLTKHRKAKTEEQKRAQSAKLKARFQTEAGAVTREQIRAATHVRLSDPKQLEIATSHLKAMGADSAMRKLRRENTLKLHSEGLTDRIRAWHKENKEESNALIARARSYNKRKTTAPHLTLKAAMMAAKFPPSQTEYPLGYYSIDEAYPEYRLAIEMDGCYWHGCVECGFTPQFDTQRYDLSKTAYLQNRDWRILRIPEHMVKRDIEKAVSLVRKALVEAGHAFGT